MTLRLDPELLLFIANILHKLESNNKIKGDFKSLNIDKKDLIVQAYSRVFSLSGTELNQLRHIIDFLEKHKTIVGIPKYKKIYNFLKEGFFYLVKRLL